MKIDAEAHDMEILHGGRQMLKNRAIRALQFEYNHRWILSRHYLKDAFDFLIPFGYSIGKITTHGVEFYSGWNQELESFREGNYLAVLSDCSDQFPAIDWWNEPNLASVNGRQ